MSMVWDVTFLETFVHEKQGLLEHKLLFLNAFSMHVCFCFGMCVGLYGL